MSPETSFGVGCFVFLAALLLDYAAARYTGAVTSGRKHAAGAWSVAMCLLSSVGVLAFVELSPWMIAPECLGLYVGTLVAVETASVRVDGAGAVQNVRYDLPNERTARTSPDR